VVEGHHPDGDSDQRSADGKSCRAAVEYGCDNVLVSNHSGRQMDESAATIDVLLECAECRSRKRDDSTARRRMNIFWD
jgi:hypothetical protein